MVLEAYNALQLDFI